MIVFGYGSLLFKPGFAFHRRERARLEGYRRVFWQGSPDHRGTPERPGRVVTLVPEPGAFTDGALYELAGDAAAALAALDVREQAGYARLHLPITTDAAVETALVYLATPDNESWLGPASPRDIAAHAASAVGPSGPNRDYVLRLADALRELGADDPHVFEIERELRALS